MKIVKLNVDENPDTAGRFGVMSIPTLIVFKDGQPVDKLVGFQPKEALMAALGQHL
jgi:thioredoxin 1